MTDASIKTYLYLLFCGANQRPADPSRLLEADLDAVYEAARANGLTSFVGWVLNENGIRHTRFSHDYDYSLRRQIVLNETAAELTKLFEKESVRHAPLKGMFLKDLYPSFGTREMGDLDILIDPRKRKQAAEAMLANGFSRVDIDPAYHDSFLREDVVAELHVRPLDAGLTPEWKNFSGDLTNRMIPEEGSRTRCRLSVEDHYLFHLAHAYKHSLATGIGLRYLLDLYFLRRAYPAETGAEEVTKALAAMDLCDYEAKAVRLADLLFDTGIDDAVLTEEQEDLLRSFLHGGICGTPGAASRVIAGMRSAEGRGLVRTYAQALRVLKENEDWYAFHSPFACRHKWARPFFVFWQGLKILKKDPSHILDTYGSKKQRGQKQE